MSDDSEFSPPCIGDCQYDNEDICRGCFRTLDEISNWALMTEEERKEIMKKLDERAQSLFYSTFFLYSHKFSITHSPH